MTTQHRTSQISGLFYRSLTRKKRVVNGQKGCVVLLAREGSAYRNAGSRELEYQLGASLVVKSLLMPQGQGCHIQWFRRCTICLWREPFT